MQSSRRNIHPVETISKLIFDRLPIPLNACANLIVGGCLSILVVVMVVAMLAGVLHHLSENRPDARVGVIVR
jgi:hypothetical protein